MQSAEPVNLKPETLFAWEEHIREAEAGMEGETEEDDQHFLWSESSRERSTAVRTGQTIAELWLGSDPLKIPDGLIHDWVGATCAVGATVDETLALIQDYANHKNVYEPEVIDSRVIARNGDHFNVYLRLLKKKILTVVLDTEHSVQYSRPEAGRALCRSYSTRISEVEHAGRPDERILPPDTGYGFLWRLYTYWRFQEKDGCTRIECRAISLTRDVPKGLGWIIDPIVRKLPKESLVQTLEATRGALLRDKSPALSGEVR